MSPLRVLAVLVVLSGGVAAAASPSFTEVEESLTCQCGCGLTVHSCNHLQCSSALPLRDEIREHMALGESAEEILAHFADKYGEKILSAPTTTGFNITAWVTPFLAVALGGVLVMVTARRWRRPVAEADAQRKRPRPAASAEHQRTLERELEDYRE